MGYTHRANIKTTRPELPTSTGGNSSGKTYAQNIARTMRAIEDERLEPYDADKELNQKFIAAGIIDKRGDVLKADETNDFIVPTDEIEVMFYKAGDRDYKKSADAIKKAAESDPFHSVYELAEIVISLNRSFIK